MTRLESLKRSAKDSATIRGHALGRWRAVSEYRAEAICNYCSMGVFIISKGIAPNEIDISGEAVALNCDDEAK